MKRREFLKSTLAFSGCMVAGDFYRLYAAGKDDPMVGNIWKGWKPGHFQVHFIYTGVGESAFYIFPDGTTMLLDCGDLDVTPCDAVPVLPHKGRRAGEWIGRYVERVNPHGVDVDYMMLSHYHSDHAGSLKHGAGSVLRDGKDYFLSGFSQAGELLHFKKAIDRAWPTFDDPLPLPDEYDYGAVGLIKSFYEDGVRHKGMVVERFRLGATDQIVPLRNPSSCRNFLVRNICANGRICDENGNVTDLYADRIKAEHLTFINENAMSLGMVFSYGPFRFFTAGDFEDRWKTLDGVEHTIEDSLANVCGRANVAKLNHHGHNSMPPKLVGALRSQVYVSCVWHQLHNLPYVMERVTDRNTYPGDRVVCPGVFPSERRAQDDGQPWMNYIPAASYDGSHIVLDVEPGGKRFTISYLTASDESMTVKSVMHFKTEIR